jgi:hypothetical protein
MPSFFNRSRWSATEHQIETLRRLIGYAESWAQFVENTSPDEYGYVMDAVDDAHIMLKQLGGSPRLHAPLMSCATVS